MQLVYNEQLNKIGLWEDGWNVVLVSRIIYAHSPGDRRHRALVSELLDYKYSTSSTPGISRSALAVAVLTL